MEPRFDQVLEHRKQWSRMFTVARKAKRYQHYHQKNMRDGRPSMRRKRRLECTRQKPIQLAVVVTKLSADRTRKPDAISKTDKTGCSWSGSGKHQMWAVFSDMSLPQYSGRRSRLTLGKKIACGSVGTYISYVISVYNAGISAYKFTTLVPNLVRVLGFSLSTTLVVQWVIMHIASYNAHCIIKSYIPRED